MYEQDMLINSKPFNVIQKQVSLFKILDNEFFK